MRDMASGSYRRALTSTFVPELLSMNMVMAGMVVVASLGRLVVGEPFSPLTPEFWFVMSMALLAGFVAAYPMNWWLVAKGLKHGMMTVRHPAPGSEPGDGSPGMPQMMPASHGAEHAGRRQVSRREIVGMLVLPVVLFALAFVAQGEPTAVVG